MFVQSINQNMNSMKYLVLGILGMLCLTHIRCQKGPQYDLAIKQVQLFDSKNKKVIDNQTILINADTIAKIIDGNEAFTAVKIINGDHRLLVPGFVDTHVHLRQMLDVAPGYAIPVVDHTFRKKLAQTLLPYGVTTAIDMGQPESWIPETITWQKNTSPDFPNYYISGGAMISKLSWDKNPSIHHTVVNSPKEGIQKVQDYANQGISNLKLYWKLEIPEMKAIISEAKKHNFVISAHVDNNMVTIPEAIELGVLNFEHFFSTMPSILNINEHWRPMKTRFGLPDGNNIDDFSTSTLFFFKYIKENPELETKLFALFDLLAAEKATISTAIHNFGAAANKTDFFSSFSKFPLRDAVDLPDFSKEQLQELQEAYSIMMDYLKIAHDKGVELRIGTDTDQAGKAMISELVLLYEAGLDIEEILQIATLNGAKAMKIDHLYGSIAVGKQADVVLFDKNPFDDYKNFTSKKTVIKSGKVLSFKKSVVKKLVQFIKEDNLKKGLDWYVSNHGKNDYDTAQAYEFIEISYYALQKEQLQEAKTLFEFTQQQFPDCTYMYNEKALNKIGYEFLKAEKNASAIFVFQFNASLFPDSYNVYDSLGEAYLKNNDKEGALKNYKKPLELNPENTNAKEMLGTIGS
ncbi:MAG: hypothetical protein COA50_10260 [Flavobacteriaceae bacterium]|nr:MAG: hypothetical protein COA50_10260 [Flavobacteriaceae bacterium]